MSTDLTNKFNTFESQIATEHTALMAAIAAIQADIVGTNEALAAMESNASKNTALLIAALGQTGACFPCPTPSITVPTVPTTPVTLDDTLCKRAQWIIRTIGQLLANADVLQSFNVIGSFNVINDAISQTIAAIAAGDTIPLPSFPEAVNIVGDYVSYAGERLFSGVSLGSQYTPLEGSLISAIFGAGNASAAQSAYNASIDASGASNGAKLLFKAIAYNALWVYAFDPASTPDLSGIDGTTCGIPSGTCFTLDFHHQVWDNGSAVDNVSETFGPFTAHTTINSSSGLITSDLPGFFDGSLDGWTLEVLIGSTLFFFRTADRSSSAFFSSVGPAGVDGVQHPFPTPVGSFFFEGATGTRIRICKT